MAITGECKVTVKNKNSPACTFKRFEITSSAEFEMYLTEENRRALRKIVLPVDNGLLSDFRFFRNIFAPNKIRIFIEGESHWLEVDGQQIGRIIINGNAQAFAT